ncbi:hypothetical protein ACWCW7_12960 [Nocardia tengchongensis]
MAGVLAGVPIHSTVVVALRLAAVGRAPDPVDTRALLAALMRADGSGDWSRICLNAGDVDAIERKRVTDGPSRGAGRWENAWLTDRCAIALDVSGRLATQYRLFPIPVGLVVIGLIADPSSAASQALRDGMHRGELLALVQSDVLGVTLSGLDSALPTVLFAAASVRGNPPPPYYQPPPAPYPPSPPTRAPGPARWPVANSRSTQPPSQPQTRGDLKPLVALFVLLAAVFVFVLAVTQHDDHRPDPPLQPSRNPFVVPTFTLSPQPLITPHFPIPRSH